MSSTFSIQILSFFFTCGILVSAHNVIDLSVHDLAGFKAEMSKFDTALVKFFAPWCGHCKRLAPEYEKASVDLANNDPPLPLVEIDCTSDNGKEICQEYGVNGYPTLKIFRSGEFSSDYNGPRDSAEIVKYMLAQVGPASKSFDSYSSMNEKLEQAKDVVVVGLFDSDSDSLATKFHSTASKLRESVTFYHAYSSSVSDDLSSLKHLAELNPSSPSVLLVRPSLMKNKFESFVNTYDESKPLDQWVTSNYHGLVGHRTQSNMQDFKLPLVVVFYNVDYTKNPKGTNYWRNRVLKVAQNYPNVNFAVSSIDTFASEVDEFGLTSENSKEPVVGARDEHNKKYILSEKFSVENLENFVKKFVDGELEPYIKSEPVPADNSGPVKIAVGKNFDELVLNNKKDVLVEFYAPWCGHCKNLAPTYDELGKALQNEPNVEIIKMDATANDVPSPFEVHGFPTLYWYPSNTKKPTKYEGGRDLNDFINYIAKHSTHELVGYSRDGKKKKEEL